MNLSLPFFYFNFCWLCFFFSDDDFWQHLLLQLLWQCWSRFPFQAWWWDNNFFCNVDYKKIRMTTQYQINFILQAWWLWQWQQLLLQRWQEDKDEDNDVKIIFFYKHNDKNDICIICEWKLCHHFQQQIIASSGHCFKIKHTNKEFLSKKEAGTHERFLDVLYAGIMIQHFDFYLIVVITRLYSI